MIIIKVPDQIKNRFKLLLCACILLSLTFGGSYTFAETSHRGKERSNYKIYVILGFHINFYHSWRGDTPDEAGFGTDIRVVREIIRMLDEANARGLDARGYWEGESLFTFEDILPKHAPDIIEGIKRRVDAGLDEVTLAPYSNSLFSAMTEREMRWAVRWSVTNPWGSGMKDIFGKYFPIIRPQEGMATTGMIPILKSEGIDTIILAYSSFPFTTFSNFVPLLPIEQRFNPTYMRMQDRGEKMILFPCVSIGDVINFTSLEKWMRDLHKLQKNGTVKSDLVIHINFDADAETWIPLVPKGLRWIPNAGGLPEYIRYVNKYKWAEFTTPSEYLSTHKPVGEVMIRQDMADGGWDGNYSWAEKFPSHVIWSALEKSRLYTYQAEALMTTAPPSVQAGVLNLLYFGRDSSFFQRVKGLSTTHFGMSTPMVNEERQAVAERVVRQAKNQAQRAFRALAFEQKLLSNKEVSEDRDVVYSFLVKDIRPEEDAGKDNLLNLVRIPVILPDVSTGYALEDDSGESLPFSILNSRKLDEDSIFAEIVAPIYLKKDESRKLIFTKQLSGSTNLEEKYLASNWGKHILDNGRISLTLCAEHGIEALKLDGNKIGGADFLKPFITYRTGKSPKHFAPLEYKSVIMPSMGPMQGLQAAELMTSIPIKTRDGVKNAEIKILFILPDKAEWVIADVDVDYPYTTKRDILHTVQQKLRRYIDLGWIEVAPFQLHPILDADRENPIRVWKHNYLNVTSYFDMDYASINPKNAGWDSMNHQVTAGWVAVTDKKHGLMLAQSSEKTTSYAFNPMRLREVDGKQQLWLNPFGSYHGRQPDYSHMGGNGLGADMAEFAGAHLKPNGPSFNGMRENFSLLIAPYKGDKPPERLRNEAMVYFYPPAVVYLTTPDSVEAVIKEDILELVAQIDHMNAREASGPLPVPHAFLASPTDGAVDIVWDEPDDARVDGYFVQWKRVGSQAWNGKDVGKANRHRISGLDNGVEYMFRMRSKGDNMESEWTQALTSQVGPVKTMSIISAAEGVSLKIVFKTLLNILDHLLTTP